MIYKHVHDMIINKEKIQLTSLVMDQNEFDELIDAMVAHNICDDFASAASFKEIKIVPLVTRDQNNEQFFSKYKISTKYLSAIVRGIGPTLLMDLKTKILKQRKLN